MAPPQLLVNTRATLSPSRWNVEKMLLPISVPPPARGVPLNGSFFSCGPIPGTPISIMGSLHHNVCSASCEGNVEHCFLCKRINIVLGPRDVIRPAAKTPSGSGFFLSYQFTWSIKSEAWIFGFPLCSLPGAPSNQSWWFWQDSGCFFEAHHGKPKEITWPWVGQNVPDLRSSDLRSDSQRVLLEVFGVLTQTSSFRIPHWWNSRLISPHEF